jgi:hypothetical protein
MGVNLNASNTDFGDERYSADDTRRVMKNEFVVPVVE